jgi:phosphatidylglycerol:prolipoprotein diacylglycerol transferase
VHPFLFSLGSLHFRVYGLSLALSFLLGSWLTLNRGLRRGLREEMLTGLFVWILVGAVVGARVHYVLAHPEQFPGPLDAFRLWEGGLTEYGGLILAVAASWIYLRRAKVPFLPVADLVAPVLALGEGITRIGCFFNGCCFGKPCQGSLCLHFPADSYAAQTLGAGVGVYPSQLVLSAALLLTFWLLLRTERLRLRPGKLFGLYLILQGGIRYAVDFTRYYEPSDRMVATAPLLVARSQLIALVLVILGVFLLARGGRPVREGAA